MGALPGVTIARRVHQVIYPVQLASITPITPIKAVVPRAQRYRLYFHFMIFYLVLVTHFRLFSPRDIIVRILA